MEPAQEPRLQPPPLDGIRPSASEPSVASTRQDLTAPLFTALDPRVLKLWRLTHLVASAVLLGMTAVGALIAGLTFTDLWHWFLIGWVVLVLLRATLWLFYLPRSYRAWGYRIDDRVLETHQGVWWQTTQLLPLPRLQHADLHRGPLERYFGLATLILHTAGTQNATLEIPGLDADHAVALRDQLVRKGGDDGV